MSKSVMHKLHKSYANFSVVAALLRSYLAIIETTRNAKPQPLIRKKMDMAVLDTTRPASGTSVTFGRIGAVIANVIGAVASWNDARITRNALAALTDRELDDIGLVRGDIDLVAESKRF